MNLCKNWIVLSPEANLRMDGVLLNKDILRVKEETTNYFRFLQRHVENILRMLKGWDINNTDLIFVGGGSKLFTKEIKKIVLML